MIQLNLLPDVKLEYIKAQRQRQLVTSISVLVTIASVALLLLLLSVSGLQKKHLNDLSRDIKTESVKLQKEPQIDKILTVQNQLQSLTGLHDAKPAASRLFEYLNQLTPSKVSINDFKIDFSAHTVTITGGADALASVNQYVDTLKFTKFSVDDEKATKSAFSDIVLSSFGVNAGSKDNSQAATYTITLTYDEAIFDITQNVKLEVPNVTSTHAELSQPTDLFKATPPTSRGTN